MGASGRWGESRPTKARVPPRGTHVACAAPATAQPPARRVRRRASCCSAEAWPSRPRARCTPTTTASSRTRGARRRSVARSGSALNPNRTLTKPNPSRQCAARRELLAFSPAPPGCSLQPATHVCILRVPASSPASYFPLPTSRLLLTDDYLPRCSECSKLFRSERHLDLHLERKHDALLQPNATVCLGE